MADQSLTLNAALTQLAEVRAAKEKAEAETQTVRTKLHGAIRKGKAFEAEKAFLSKKLEKLAAIVPKVRASARVAQSTLHWHHGQADIQGDTRLLQHIHSVSLRM